MTAILTIQNGKKVVNNGLNENKVLLEDINLSINEGDFITVLGGNGAGKSTLFNTIAGTLQLSQGSILFKDRVITKDSEEKRAAFLARVFQDPKMGTAPRMTVAENLLLAQKRGQKRPLHLRNLKKQKEFFYQLCQEVGNGLETHLDTPAGELSGGQRQALSLLMATIRVPELLLLDEHTAALDPKTAKSLMELTNRRITEQKLTCLMITHRMEDALNYGNRLIVLQKGRIVQDLNAQEKQNLSMSDLLQFFEEVLD
ncbi:MULTISPECIES: ABC transporter ATP-binding protein [Enterococcus]|uniref:ABC transporter ATP-binding protein n=1 Tax=Enterococcus thailandicus TaxID=417368 RepID=A0A179ETG3_ENTTH|nr:MULTISPECIES: ATP-binding cassette domain-containing protein [Enterococcus]ASZ07656.1 ABC transporter ATP-binding protein [Enterococcus thailandicus]MDA3965593.1 ATP-binding cassette domain-containing protein [Enterococcus thailandicus]MDK4350997.1 ATP-binding cassette domain-containing protein [Enterococcus thailandicus]MDT2733349.1 ATP-binding cassette domain-containing protein [Enterococcus thailandicus]MDT2750653.1 ATP-binding cassette domain-containing protein [Enterococcus thailandicu